MTNEIYFYLEGEFLGVCALDGYKLKYLRLRTAERDVIIKVPKELRLGMVYKLAIGDRLRCEGIQKDWKFKASTIEKVDRAASFVSSGCLVSPPCSGDPTGESRLHGRGHRPEQATAENRSALVAQFSAAEAMPTVAAQENKPKVKILICQKSHCRNNGSTEIYSALAAQLNSHGLNDSVTLKSTGCLKCCKQAPNLVVLPVGKTALAAASPRENLWHSLSGGKSSYHNVRISQIPAIISNVRYHLSIEPK